MMSEPSWVALLREAASGRGQDGVEVARGARPSWLGPDALHAITSCFLAALVIAAAVLRARLGRAGVDDVLARGAVRFDLIALLLHTASVAFVLRAAIALARLGARLARARHARACVLAWSAHGLYLRDPGGERWLAQADIVGFALPQAPAQRGTDVSLQPLYVVTSPHAGSLHWELPPYFAARPEILAARLERARNQGLPSAQAGAPVPTTPPEERYLRAARGAPGPEEIVVPEGFGYRLRAPYGALLALTFVADALRVAGPARDQLWPVALGAAALSVSALLGWFAWMRARRAVRLGLALLLTPEELLLRGKHGVVSIPWTQLARAEVSTRLSWSPFVGSYAVRVLWFHTLDGGAIPVDGAFLGVPPEVVATLAEAHRNGSYGADRKASTASSTPASHGSGAGGGISGSADTTASATNPARPTHVSANCSADAELGRSNET